MKKFICSVCGYIYDEAAGIPDRGIDEIGGAAIGLGLSVMRRSKICLS